MELLIPLFLLFIFILQIFLTKAAKKQRELPSSEEEIGDIFETLGFPKPPVQPKRVEPEIIKPEVLEEIIPSEKIEKPPTVLAEEPKKEMTLSRETLEEGIILSVILGPPRAKEIFMPRWWNWHARGSQKPVTVRS